MKYWIVLSLLFSSIAFAGLMDDFDSLGGNDELLSKAQSIAPNKTISIVQSRIVSRENRHELSPEYFNVIGGDAYLETQYLGLSYHYHLNHHWSFGLTYRKAYNALSSEGKKLIDELKYIPDTDHPLNMALASVRWYPIYGKFNLYDLGVVQFDMYFVAGYGEIELESGRKSLISVGPGIGFWLSQHLTVRSEFLYQTYKSERYLGDDEMKTTQVSLSVGYLL